MATNPAIQAFSDKVNAVFDTMGDDVGNLVDSLNGIAGDEKFLKDTIDALQNSPGNFTPEDQKLVDAIQARVDALGAKVTAAKTAAASLDSATDVPPTP